MTNGVRRGGELSQQSLEDAMLDERGRGLSANLLAVGSNELELRALRILQDEGPLGALRPATASVMLDRRLAAEEWELRMQ